MPKVFGYEPRVWIPAAIAGAAGLGAAAFYVARRDKPPLLTAARATPAAPASGIISAAPVMPTMEGKAVWEPLGTIPARAEKEHPGLIVWGTKKGEGAFQPAYLKSEGCKDLRWGVCLPDLIDELQKHPNAPKWTRNLDEIIVRIGNIIAAGAGTISKWIVDRACVRFKFPLGRYKTVEGDTLYAVHTKPAGLALVGVTPPHPLPRLDGWKRVWIDTVAQPGTRNETALVVYWPRTPENEPYDPVIQELLSRTQIRAMLRMSADVTGAITAKQLATAGAQRGDCGKSKWWLARRSKAMDEFR